MSGLDVNEEETRNGETDLLSLKTSSNARPKHRRRRWVKEWWFWEIGGCFLSVGCMVTIIVLLRFDEKPRSQWKLSISPNTLVSTLTTIAKTALLLPVAECLTQLKWRHFSLQSHPLADVESFDAASRGPWGAFVFPWKTKLKSRIALMGALIVAGSLTMEPLGQVAVSYRSQLVFPPANDVKNENRSGIFVAQAYNTGAREYSVELYDRNAFFEGIFGMGREMPLNCVNGNCTWPEFVTLGVCSSCQDVTSAYQPTKKSCNGTNDSQTCVYNDYEEIGRQFGDSYQITTGNETRNTLIKGISSLSNDTRLIASFILGRFEQYSNFSDEDRDGFLDLVKSAPELTQCNISWCAELYQNFTYQNVSSLFSLERQKKLVY
ncbi:uncharacterized protein K452DRAFT_237227 [Aplosporella prunicola CBS 121167]|uniref:Uncharacterized protein n=1 Tax=Aplosporella prunicola CBS 121167 TaxID=1176127 RepID=A0A6A6AZ93_9PEZI|nr:uncharacterized protein K452DRAFT_237227 [Aplosporella prunicola CBS 121167]KAF2136588.1 hypothetical protein K452DRAFT_237227 [Aplosporella prunicola CBS 121167]